jgi:predicted GNAT family acetyltransferase
MDVRLIDDVSDFATAAESFLQREPFSANVIAVQVDGILRLGRPRAPGSVWALAEEDGELVGIAMQTPPFALFLPRLEGAAAEAIAEALAEAHVDLPGVSGEAAAVERFAGAWGRLGGKSSITRRAMRLYVLGDLRLPEAVPGTARRADDEDLGLVQSWFRAFQDEVPPSTPAIDLDGVARRRVSQGEVWLWQHDGQTASLAGVSAPALGVARVGPVYTSPASRRRGYGAAVTAAASHAAINAGATNVVLYTDLANPTSNSIYQAIGYVPDHDAEERDFVS